MTALYVAGALLAGVVVGWFLGRRGGGGADGRLEEELRRQAEGVRAELRERDLGITELRERLAKESTALASSRADLQAVRSLLGERQALHETQLAEEREMREKALRDLRETFKALSAEALSASAPDFLRLAQESFGKLREASQGDLQQRQESIAGLLKPLEEQLRTYQQRLQQSETAQAQALGEVKRQLEALGQQSQLLAGETERFRAVLRSGQARGRWGEETLRRVVEAAGMSPHCDFLEQVSEADARPDMVVRLPGERVILVDSKVPDLEFLAAMDLADTEKRSALLRTHAARLRETVKDLAKRDYPRKFRGALDHVVLFLPAESLFSAALEGDPELIVAAASHRILLATPASLIALLRAAEVAWQQAAQAENSEAIATAARELYERVVLFVDEHFVKVRDGLRKAGDAFNAAVGSYERRIRPSGERLARLGIATGGRSLSEIEPVETELRLPSGGEGG
ncbi:MAG: DNA recombination protein RmuC [Deltaproteobacteria bacterium]|nr:DNA recombination protein RmuC [Deltaproteobacteria bacterium]